MATTFPIVYTTGNNVDIAPLTAEVATLTLALEEANSNIDYLLHSSAIEWREGNTSDVCITTIGSWRGLVLLRPDGDPSVDPRDYLGDAPENWQLDLNRYVVYDEILAHYYLYGTRVISGSKRYHTAINGNWRVQPTGDSDSNWIIERDWELVSTVSGSLSMGTTVYSENVLSVQLPVFDTSTPAGIIVVGTFDGFTDNSNINPPNLQLPGFSTIVATSSSDSTPNIGVWWKPVASGDSQLTITPQHLSNPNIVRGLSAYVVNNMTNLTANPVDANESEATKSVGNTTIGSMQMIIASQKSNLATLNTIPGFTYAIGQSTHGQYRGHVSAYAYDSSSAFEPSVAFSAAVRGLAVMLHIT